MHSALRGCAKIDHHQNKMEELEEELWNVISWECSLRLPTESPGESRYGAAAKVDNIKRFGCSVLLSLALLCHADTVMTVPVLHVKSCLRSQVAQITQQQCPTATHFDFGSENVNQAYPE